jgi:hypothetical protein
MGERKEHLNADDAKRGALDAVRGAEIAFVFTKRGDSIEFHCLIPERVSMSDLSAVIAGIEKRTNEVVAHFQSRAGEALGLAKPPPGFDPKRRN